MAKVFEKTHTRRIVALALFSVLLFSLATVRSFQYQIVDGDTYKSQAESGRTTAVSVAAARGEIVDRNGKAFTQNKAAFQIEFDFTFMPKLGNSQRTLDNEAVNAIIYKLIRVFEEWGEEWIDNLPVSLAEPYGYLPDASDSELNRLRTTVDVNESATAEDCLYWLYRNTGIQKYKVDGKCTHCGEPYEECDYKGYSEEYARKIAGVRYEMITKDFSSYNTRYTFAEDVDSQLVAWIEEQSDEFPGITVTPKAMRTYVSGDVASHLIGKVGPIYKETWEIYKQKNKEQGTDYTMSDIVGQAGIESVMEDVLRGKNGTMVVNFNAEGDVTGIEESVAPVAGNTVQLTIDYDFQKELQQILADYIEEFNASATAAKQDKHSEAASIVVLDAKTGGMLACVSYPYFDINSYNEMLTAEGNPLFNRALQGLYAPGSSFKPVVAAAALQEGIINGQTEIYCSMVYDYYAPSYTPGCLGIGSGHPYHYLDVSQALQYSCNIFFYDTGRRLGIDKMNQYANLFGLGVDTGLELPNAVGRLTTKEDADWQAGNVVQAAIGQKNTQVTPLQMAVEALTLANHGTRYQAHVVQAILDNDGKEVISRTEPQILSSFELADENYDLIIKGMVDAANSMAGAYRVNDFGYTVGIKTGTPQTGRINQFGDDETNNDFIAIANVEDPEIVISCLVEDGYNSNQLLRRILLAWEKCKNGGELPESLQASSETASSASSVSSGTSGASSAQTSSQAQTSTTTRE